MASSYKVTVHYRGMNSLFGNWIGTLRRYRVLLVLSILLPIFGISNSAQTAERIYVSYSVLQRSISVATLEEFALSGKIKADLAVYTQYLQPEQVQELRRILITPIKVHPVAVSQFLYTSQGELMLKRLGEVIQTQSREATPGFYALRSALILAADEPDGLTPLNLLRKFPNSSIHVNLERTLAIASELEKLVTETSRAVEAVALKSNTEAAIATKSNTKLPSLRRQGKFVSSKQTLKLFDSVRGRFLLTDVYLPNIRSQVPVIVVSHGIGTDSSNFRYLANYLASYGFAVVVPNHPGSDTRQVRSLLTGGASEVADSEEFIDRPLDIKYILDELETLNKSDSRFRNRLDLGQVGVFGQSLGGYTALALAGAKINEQQLAKDCSEDALQKTWNMSLLLQCRATELPGNISKKFDLRDERVKAVIAVNPITSSIFGKAGLSKIQVPGMIVGSTDDTVTPALYEQILPFSWISNSRKYLVILSGATHFSIIGEANGSTEQVKLPSELVGDNPRQAQGYMKVLSMPFFQTYVARTSVYTPYLNAAYAKSISSGSVSLSMIQNLTTTELARAVKLESGE